MQLTEWVTPSELGDEGFGVITVEGPGVEGEGPEEEAGEPDVGTGVVAGETGVGPALPVLPVVPGPGEEGITEGGTGTEAVA